MNKNGDNNDEGEDVIYCNINADSDYSSLEVVETIAELEGKKSSELPAIYDAIGHLIEELFSNPPSPEAEVILEFSYEGYRITLNQDSHATFRKITEEE